VGKYFRRSRSAAKNIIPNVVYSTKWVEQVLPKFKGRLEGAALNVPVPLGSLLDLTTVFEKEGVTIEAVNAAVSKAAEKMASIVEVTEDPIVSSDVIGNTHSAVFDTQATMKSPGKMVKTLTWYDNSLAQASRIIDIINAYRTVDAKGGAA
jgi:glyceraldehyde 3-phosphate dehydrogenase